MGLVAPIQDYRHCIRENSHAPDDHVFDLRSQIHYNYFVESHQVIISAKFSILTIGFREDDVLSFV